MTVVCCSCTGGAARPEPGFPDQLCPVVDKMKVPVRRNRI